MTETTIHDNSQIGTNGTDSEDPADSSDGWLQSLRTKLGLGDTPSLRDVLEEALNEKSQSVESFSAPEREMLLRLLHFGSQRIDDVMVPRVDITALDEQVSLVELLSTFETAGHSRIPIYSGSLDDLRGMIHIKDFVGWMMSTARDQCCSEPAAETTKKSAGGESNCKKKPDGSTTLRNAISLGGIDLACPIASTELIREVLYVPPSMPAVNLLLRMQSTHVHLAMVVDEYGGVEGLVSIEDLVEEIVGEIEDEHDEHNGDLITLDPALGLVADARTPIEELESYLELTLLENGDDEDIDTLGGLVFAIAGRIPVRGELIKHSVGVEFEVLDADPRRVKKLRIHRRSNSSSNDDGESDSESRDERKALD